MRTSQSFAAEELRRCVPHGSLPPCGGGTGRGWRQGTVRDAVSALRFLKIRNLGAAFVRYRIGNNRCACCTPLPVPPPQGGRERCGTALHTSRAACAFASRHVCISLARKRGPRGHKRVHARLQRAMHSDVAKSGSPVPRGRTESVSDQFTSRSPNT